jgi:RecB family endonuclease NucS
MPSDFLEKTLETIIVDNYKIISERGLALPYRHIDRQFQLPSGKIIDIVNWQVDDKVIRLSVLELKKDAGTEQALWQLLRYVDEITQYLIGWFEDI